MSLVTFSFKEMRTGLSFISVTDIYGAPIVDGDVLDISGSFAFTVNALVDGSVPRYIGWVKVNGTAVYMSDPIVDWRGRDIMDLTQVEGIALDNLFVGDGLVTKTITTTISAPSTIEISAMAMISVEGYGGSFVLFTVDAYDGVEWTRKGYGATNISINSEAILADATIARCFLGIFVRQQNEPGLRNFYEYLLQVKINGTVRAMNSPYPVSHYHYFGEHTKGTIGGVSTFYCKAVPSVDTSVLYQNQQWPLIEVQLAGSGYGHRFQATAASVILPNQGNQWHIFSTLRGDVDLGSVGYPHTKMAKQYINVISNACSSGMVEYLDVTNAAHMAIYQQYLAGAVPITAVPLTSAVYTPSIYYSYIGVAPGLQDSAFVTGGNLVVINNPNTGLPLAIPTSCEVRATSFTLGWSEGKLYSFFSLATPYVGIDGNIYLDAGTEIIRFIRVIHETITNCTVTPPHLSVYPVGSNIQVEVANYYPSTITLFEIDHLSRINDLTDVIESITDVTDGVYVKYKEHTKGLLLENCQDDVYISAVAETQTINHTPGTPITIQCHGGCHPNQTWLIDITPSVAGASIDNTGLITLNLPYSASAGDYTLTVTLNDGGHTVTRTIPLLVDNPPVYGNVWAPVTKFAEQVDSMLLTSTNMVILVAGANIYRSTDNGLNFTSILANTGYTGVKNGGIIENSTGDIFVFQYKNNVEFIVSKSTDGGASFTKIKTQSQAWCRPINMFDYGSGTFYGASHNSGSAVMIDKSVDSGLNWTEPTWYGDGLNYWWSDLVKIESTGTMVAWKSNTGGPIKFLRAPLTTPTVFTASANTFPAGGNAVGVISRQLTMQGDIIAGGYDTFTSVYKSSDDGVTWFEVTGTGLSATPTTLFCQRHVVLAGMSTKIMRSETNGATFVNVAAGSVSGSVRCMILLPNGHLLAGTDGAASNLYRSES